MTDKHADLNESADYEKRDTKTLKIAVIGVVVILLIVVSIIVLNEIFLAYREQVVAEHLLNPESADLRLIRAQEAELLSSYAYIDSADGVVRIPIERAMELIAAEAYAEFNNAGK